MIIDYKKKYIIILMLLSISLFSCNEDMQKSNLYQETSVDVETLELNKKIDYKYYDVFDISPVEIIVPKNQTISQSLSVVVTDNNGNTIVFDGGRQEDADYLCDIIKEKGGEVKYWYLTHIHDDHIGTLYKILSEKRTDIKIGTIIYSFASFDWYYSKMGNDAGILNLFENALYDYNDYVSRTDLDRHIGYIRYAFDEKDRTRELTYKDAYSGKEYTSIKVRILNNRYELDQDPINNTTITYLVQIKNRINMLIFGDLGYEGGFKWLSDVEKDKRYGESVFNADILVLAHHGQNGIDPEIYKKFSPKVVVWPTSKDVYENRHGQYYTDDTKKALAEIKSIKYQIKSYEETAIIR